MSRHPPGVPDKDKAAAPRHAASWDAWNSSSTGHQRPEQQPGTGWRESRNKKLNSQFRAGGSGGARISDTWGPGAENYDAERKAVVPAWVKEMKGRSVMDMLKKPGLMREAMETTEGKEMDSPGGEDAAKNLTAEEALSKARRVEDEEREANRGGRGIFFGTVVYVNGSTYPLVSDHKLKQLLTENGAQMSLHLGRRRVTHVVLGRPAGGGRGAGGGLAGGKMDKEIKKIGGCGVKYVGVEW